MKKINIQINNAKILGFSVDLKEDEMPTISAIIGLFAGLKKISTFHLRTEPFYGDSLVFEIPPLMIESVLNISKELETILIRECNKQLKALPMPKQ